MNARKISLIAAVLLLGLLAACSSDDGPATPSYSSFTEVIDAGGTYEKVEPSESIEPIASDEDVLEDGTVMLCTTEHYSIIDAPDDYVTFDPNAEVIFPGNLLQGGSLGGNSPTPIVLDRAGGVITINLVNGSEVVSQQVDEVLYSSVIQAMNDIIADNSGTLPAAFTYKSAEVQSREQMALSMGVNVHSLTSDVRARLSLSQDTSYNSFLVELNQRYYTMSFDMPSSPAALFQASVVPADLARFVSADNPATYISSVTYGRRFYLLIESTESVSEMSASISASYEAALAGGSGHLSGRDVSSLSNVNVKVFALGGDASLALAAFNGDVDAVAEFLTEGGDIDTGVPLSYVVRNVKDNSVVNIKVATDFDVRNCVVQTIGTYRNDFEGSTEGWTPYADHRNFGVYSSGGIDGDYIRLHDRGEGGTCYFRAPLAYQGDWSQFVGGELSCYLWIGGPGSAFATDDVVFYDGSGNRLAARWAHQPYDNGFFPFRVNLDASQNWRYNGAAATQAQIESVLGDVVDLFIRAEYRDAGGDWCAMDLFRVEQPETD
ncbi:MAG: thiol-activated cytolysin family protein [Candidatus Krumholzibacteriia bacterium]